MSAREKEPKLSWKSRFRPSPVPFAERGGTARGIVDLLTGCYPAFLFGGSLKEILPVFHFHDISRDELEPYFVYLAENGYRTVTSESIRHFVLRGGHPGPNHVALCFDDAWASLWTVVGPLLEIYGLTAITYAIPARMSDADSTRPTIETDPDGRDAGGAQGSPFVTWPELRALHESGRIDVQSHTFSHSSIYCSNRIDGYVTPGYRDVPYLSRPSIHAGKDCAFMRPSDLGAPLFPQRSRMSDAIRYFDDGEARRRCIEFVAAEGGEGFFTRPGWKSKLDELAGRAGNGYFESPEERARAIRLELERGREILSGRLKVDTVRHLCFPWGIAGNEARSRAEAVGFHTAFSDRMFGFRAVRYGDNPYRLMRLKYQFIFHLPGSNRRRVIDMMRYRSPSPAPSVCD